MTPGIPAFIAAGSAARLPLALNDDSVVVLAQIDTLDELEKNAAGTPDRRGHEALNRSR